VQGLQATRLQEPALGEIRVDFERQLPEPEVMRERRLLALETPDAVVDSSRLMPAIAT
jgi:hypothetical protein